jgi:hypothetical protein
VEAVTSRGSETSEAKKIEPTKDIEASPGSGVTPVAGPVVAGSYDRHLHTKAGEVTLTVQKLRSLPFETAIIERYRRRESSVEEALIEVYLAGVSVRRVEDITQALWGTKVSASTVSCPWHDRDDR